ncbi:MAG: trypsin-like peptidase domain-containing protein [Planctomycetales bacterium]|nr:trypsin-like peptidase domain-containing protein [Planctomycetales bacterium]
MSKSATLTLRTVLLLGSMLAGLKGAQANPQVYESLLDSTVCIVNPEEKSSGTGVVVDAEKRLVVTNYHVVGKASTVAVYFSAYNKEGNLETNWKAYAGQFEELHFDRIAAVGKVIGTWEKRDLALVQLDVIPDDVEGVKLAERSIQPGQSIHSIGNPDASDAMWVYSPGSVRAILHKSWKYDSGQKVESYAIETTSPINSGDSGGPVVNDQGELVGINASFSNYGRLFSTAIDIREVRSLLDWHTQNVQAANSPQLAQW